MTEYPYVYVWKLAKLFGAAGSPLYGLRCRVLIRAGGGKNGRLVEFEGGERHVILGNALRKAKLALVPEAGAARGGEELEC